MELDVICGESRSVMAAMSPDTYHALVTDPPYNLEFMGKDWDKPTPGSDFHEYFHGGAYQRWTYLWASEALRILKPGAHMLVFGGTRTWHRMACGIEDAGFEVRDCLMWLYGTGFPKSLDVSKAIDKAAGAEREIIGEGINYAAKQRHAATHDPEGGVTYLAAPSGPVITAPATSEAVAWEGYGTALKPAWEPILLVRKPLSERTVAANVLRWGTGALNIDGTRIGTTDTRRMKAGGPNDFPHEDDAWEPQPVQVGSASGRWPANVALDERAGEMLGEPARFFYCAKASRSERERGLEDVEPVSGAEAVDRKPDTAGLKSPRAGAGRSAAKVRNIHPTVKPVELMRWLVRMVTPPEGRVLDPFVGSGTTLIAVKVEGFAGTGIDMSPEYCNLARQRVAAW